MKSTIFKIIENDNEIILKLGRKKYATISLNENPEFAWCLWFSSFCLSGYKTPQDAINRAEKMRMEWVNEISQLIPVQ